MKYHITKEEFEALPESMRAEYREVGDGPAKGKFRLQLSDNPIGEFRESNATLITKNEALAAEVATLKTKVETLTTTIDAYKDDDGNPIEPARAKELVTQVAAKGGKKDASFEEALQRALKPFTDKIAQVEADNAEQKRKTEEANQRAKKSALESHLRSIADPVLVPSTSSYVIDEMVNGGYFDYDPDTRTLTPLKTDGEGLKITPTRFLDGKRQTHGNLFKASGVPGKAPQREGEPPQTDADGKEMLYNPDPLTLGKRAKDIAAGKVKVVRT